MAINRRKVQRKKNRAGAKKILRKLGVEGSGFVGQIDEAEFRSGADIDADLAALDGSGKSFIQGVKVDPLNSQQIPRGETEFFEDAVDKESSKKRKKKRVKRKS